MESVLLSSGMERSGAQQLVVAIELYKLSKMQITNWSYVLIPQRAGNGRFVAFLAPTTKEVNYNGY